jgi:hypothetical protein
METINAVLVLGLAVGISLVGLIAEILVVDAPPSQPDRQPR